MGLLESAGGRDGIRCRQAVEHIQPIAPGPGWWERMTAIPVSNISLEGKKALVRCDFNVPMDKGRITDSSRIDASLDTIRHILSRGGAGVLCSHLGRPKERTPELSLKPIAEYLSSALGRKVALAPDCIGEFSGRMVNDLALG